LDETHLEIVELETEMSNIQDAASLFEVCMTDFKQVRQCRKELRMLKVKQLIFYICYGIRLSEDCHVYYTSAISCNCYRVCVINSKTTKQNKAGNLIQ